MSGRNIIRQLSKELRDDIPTSLGSVSELSGMTEGSVIYMKKTKRLKPAVKIAIAVAAAAVALTLTVTAVNFTGLIDERDAFAAAYNHLYETSEGEEQKDIANLILAGMPIEDAAEMESADIGLKGLRPVYNLTFTMVETVYHYTVDAKTGVIIASSSEPLETSESREPVYERHPFVISEAEKNAEYNRTYALYAVQEHFGCFSRTFPGADGAKFAVNFFNDVYSSEDGYYEITYCGGGYKYSCKVDMTNGEIYDDKIELDDLYTGEEEDRFKVEPLEGVIGHNAALKAACEAAGIEYTLKYCGDAFLGYVEYFDAGSFSSYVPYNSAVYPVTLNVPDAGKQRFRYKVYVDAVTGEALSVTQLGIIGINKSEDEYHSDLNRGQLAIYAVRHRFGLTDWPTPEELPGEYVFGSAERDMSGNFLVAVKYDGYIYRCTVDPETFAILSENVEEDPMTAERTLHQGDPNMIGQVRAIEIVAEKTGLDPYDPDVYFVADCELMSDGRKVYHTYFNKRGAIANLTDSYYIDCYSGEIVEVIDPLTQQPAGEASPTPSVGADPTKPYEANQVPSTEAENGEISEAAAFIAVLEDLGITDRDVESLKIGREGGEFVFTFYISDIETVYRVDAGSGKITGKSGVTPDKFITPDQAEEIATHDSGLRREAISALTVERGSQYSTLFYRVTYVYRSISYFAEVEIMSGEILSASCPMNVPPEDISTSMTKDGIIAEALKQLGISEYDAASVTVTRDTATVTLSIDGETLKCEVPITLE